jgi:hypothetical protein
MDIGEGPNWGCSAKEKNMSIGYNAHYKEAQIERYIPQTLFSTRNNTSHKICIAFETCFQHGEYLW